MAFGALLGCGVLATSCSNNGLSLARQACVHVDTSIRLYTDSQREADPAKAAEQQRKATIELEAALQLAAQANSADPQWNPLMTTLQEVGRNSEGHLITALRAQCTQAAQPNEEAPVVTSPPSGPSPATPAQATPTQGTPSPATSARSPSTSTGG